MEEKKFVLYFEGHLDEAVVCVESAMEDELYTIDRNGNDVTEIIIREVSTIRLSAEVKVIIKESK